MVDLEALASVTLDHTPTPSSLDLSPQRPGTFPAITASKGWNEREGLGHRRALQRGAKPFTLALPSPSHPPNPAGAVGRQEPCLFIPNASRRFERGYRNLVPGAGFEPARPKPRDFKSLASTIPPPGRVPAVYGDSRPQALFLPSKPRRRKIHEARR